MPTAKLHTSLRDNLPGGPPNDEADQRPFRSTPMVGLGVFLAVISSLFFLLSAALGMRQQMPDWSSVQLPWQLWLNTSILCLSSFAMQGALWLKDRGRVSTGLFTCAGMLAMLFLLGQGLIWQLLVERGYPLASNPANSFFYLISGLHGIHLLGGLIAWARAEYLLVQLKAPRQTRQRMVLCTTYWHYLLLVWLVMFGLMLLN